jgi:hypothetical protein
MCHVHFVYVFFFRLFFLTVLTVWYLLLFILYINIYRYIICSDSSAISWREKVNFQ